ncbi:MAG: ThiF family adenylyltransferase [Streptosporangiaceae bacterium]|jgi:molybdopterin/thiamine biosynthesis adenylyltransferase
MRLPLIKHAQRPQLRPNGAIWIGHSMYGRATELVEDSGVLWSICERMDGTRTIAQLAAEVVAKHPGPTDEAEVREMIAFLIDSGWVQDADPVVPPTLTDRDLDRYSRGTEFLSTLSTDPKISGLDLQAKLKASRVVVLGLGGVGSAVAASLAASGIGQLHCVDHDTVELSNLNRQLLYSEAVIGELKNDAAVAYLRSLNSDIEVTGADLLLDGPEAVLKAVGDCDAIVLCADKPADEIGLWTNEAAYTVGVPFLTAGYAGPLFTTACFIPGRTVCYACHLSYTKDRRKDSGVAARGVPYVDSGPAAIIAPVAQIAGHYLALETINLLTGLPVQTAGRELSRFVMDYEQQHYLATGPLADCPVGCGGMLAR